MYRNVGTLRILYLNLTLFMDFFLTKLKTIVNINSPPIAKKEHFQLPKQNICHQALMYINLSKRKERIIKFLYKNA